MRNSSFNVTLSLDPLPGCSIEWASEDAQRVADLLGVGVRFEFNGVECLAVPEGDWRGLAKAQHSEQARRSLCPPLDQRYATSRTA